MVIAKQVHSSCHPRGFQGEQLTILNGSLKPKESLTAL